VLNRKKWNFVRQSWLYPKLSRKKTDPGQSWQFLCRSTYPGRCGGNSQQPCRCGTSRVFPKVAHLDLRECETAGRFSLGGQTVSPPSYSIGTSRNAIASKRFSAQHLPAEPVQVYWRRSGFLFLIDGNKVRRRREVLASANRCESSRATWHPAKRTVWLGLRTEACSPWMTAQLIPNSRQLLQTPGVKSHLEDC